MDTVVMRYIFRYDTRYIIDRWNLDVSSSRSRRWSETRA